MARAGVVTATTVWIGVGPLLTHDPRELALGFPIAIACSYLPDLDHGGSTAGQAVGKRTSRLLRTATGGHRMGAHSLVAIALIGYVSWFLFGTPVEAPPALLGYAGHIFTDMLTVQGVGLLYPWSRRKFRFPTRLKTGGHGETVYVRIMSAIGLLAAFYWINVLLNHYIGGLS